MPNVPLFSLKSLIPADGSCPGRNDSMLRRTVAGTWINELCWERSCGARVAPERIGRVARHWAHTTARELRDRRSAERRGGHAGGEWSCRPGRIHRRYDKKRVVGSLARSEDVCMSTVVDVNGLR